MKNILYIICMALFFNAYSQSPPFDITSEKIEWEYVKPSVFLAVNDTTEDCFIAYGSTKLIIPFELLNYSNPYSTSYFRYQLKKHQFIKYNTEQGIKDNSRFDLPLNFTNLHNAVYRDSIDFYENYQNKIDYSLEYAGFRIWRDGEPIKAKVTTKLKYFYLKNVRAIYNSGSYYHYTYTIANLLPGDVLEVQYYQKEYDLIKYYINSQLKIKKLHLEFDYFEPRYTKTIEAKLVTPKKYKADSIIVKNKNHQLKKLIYNIEDPQLVKIEKGSHPQKDLDYFEYKYLQFIMPDSAENYQIHDQNYLYHYRRYVTTRKTYKHLLKDAKTVYYRKLSQRLCGAPDKPEIQKLMSIHEALLDSFKYELSNKNLTDSDKSIWFDYTALKKQRLIHHFFSKELWRRMFDQNNLKYHITTLYDKRFNHLDYNCIKVMDEDFVFCYIQDNTPFYFIPRFSNYKYRTNELPFYYEGINVVLIPQNVELDNYFTNNYEMPVFQTPVSTELENYRVVNYSGKADMATGEISFNTKLSLSGQFSTLTRNFYIEGLRDSTVNQRYYNQIYSLGPKTVITSKELISEEKSFPFKTIFKFDFTSKGIIKKQNDSTASFSMYNLLKHVYYSGIKGNRETNFYFDFKHTDTQTWAIQFDKTIELPENKINISIPLKNGNYKFIVTLQNESTLLIKSDLKITDEQFTPAEFSSVYDLFHFFDDLENKSFTIKLK